eukprot:PITA_07760
MINERLEVCMDNFTPYEDYFEQALQTLEKFLERCIATRLCLSHEKCHMMMAEGLIPGHYISTTRIQVDLAKIQDRPGKENLVADLLSRVPRTDYAVVVEEQFLDEHLFAVTVKTPWYANVVNYLVVGKLPKHLTPRERKLIVQHNTQFSWIRGYLFHIGADMHIRMCIMEDKIYDILKSCYDGPCGGHFADRRTGHKILQMGYYWPTIFKDTEKFV